jgi:ankyrin repeat protein
LLLENKAGVDKATSKGGTPLFLMSQEGKLEVVKWLVEDGKADVDKATNDGCTPLYVASVLGQLEIVKDMKGKGAKD